jgi:hypothetical protein
MRKKFRDELFVLTHSIRCVLTISVVVNHRTALRSPSFGKSHRGSHSAAKPKFDGTNPPAAMRRDETTTYGMFRLKNENSLTRFPTIFDQEMASMVQKCARPRLHKEIA